MTGSSRFSFGRNWHKYLDQRPEGADDAMTAYVKGWLGGDLAGQRLVDIGAGQGLASLAAHRLGARVTSFDVDPESVTATERTRKLEGSPATWEVTQGSILDKRFVQSLGTFDIAVSWGVLHHTGSMWEAVDNAASLVKPGGVLWLALYHRTAQSGSSLAIKQLYGASPSLGKTLLRAAYAAQKLAKLALRRRPLPAIRGAYDERGMNWWRDIEDWLGGLPYEVASPGEVLARLRPQGFELTRLTDALGEGGNDVYLFSRKATS